MKKIKAVLFAMIAVAMIFSLAQAQDEPVAKGPSPTEAVTSAPAPEVTISRETWLQMQIDKAQTKKALIRLQFEKWDEIEIEATAELQKLQPPKPAPESGD